MEKETQHPEIETCLFIFSLVFIQHLQKVTPGVLEAIQRGRGGADRPGATIRPTRRSPRAQGKGGHKNDQKRGAKLIKEAVIKGKKGDNFP